MKLLHASAYSVRHKVLVFIYTHQPIFVFSISASSTFGAFLSKPFYLGFFSFKLESLFSQLIIEPFDLSFFSSELG